MIPVYPFQFGALRTIFTILFLLFATLSAYSSTHSDAKPVITGKVVSKSAEAVIGAHIVVNGTLIAAVTDLDGEFALYNLPEGTYLLEISAIGYKKTTRTVEVKANTIAQLDVIFDADEIVFPEILVLGKSDRIFSKTPGAAAFINSTELKAIAALSGNEVFRRVPGLHVVDEEGAGMRVNIGIRGLDPDRSRSLLVLEDGIPVALAPYGEPEMYYTPPMDRMSGVEILKGSGQVLYGPQTIGGVVNYITAAPPAEAAGKIQMQVGQGGYLNTLINYGNTYGNTGFNVTLLRKSADQLGLTQFDITDFNTKLLLQLSPQSALSVKLGLYDETSNSTYVGLTQPMYDQGGQDFTHLAPDDKLDVRRYSLSFSHDWRLSAASKLKTTAFAYTTTRNWRRQDFSSNSATNTKPANWTGVTWGDESVVGGALYMRSSTANRDRRFEVAGVESRLETRYTLANLPNTLQTGVRYLHEKAYEQRVNGAFPAAVSGALVEDEARPGSAVSVYIQNRTEIGAKFDLHYGARFENFNYGRDIYRRSFNINGQNTVRDTLIQRNSTVRQLIPGGGFTWRPLGQVQVFGGVHAGFAPPRTKDAIAATGEVYELDAEQSINSELGIRATPTKGLYVEVTGFLMDFSNQIIPVSESSGGAGAGLVNGGQTVHRGIEGALNLGIGELAGWTKTSLALTTNATFADAYFSGDRQQDGQPLAGNTTPYAPAWLLNTALTLELYGGFNARITSNYVGEQYADEQNTVVPSADGRIGRIPAYHTLDASVGYHIRKWNTSFTVAVKNLADERYLVSRRPQGIRVGLPRFLTVGVSVGLEGSRQ